MIKKIVSIKNLGRFKQASYEGDSHFAKHTLIVGANGYGKTTLCAMLRSLQSGKPEHLLGRKTLGVQDNISVDLLLEGGTTRFEGTTWRSVAPSIAIFDGTFVAENVHSGDVVDLEHKRSLYRVIIGQEGVRLAEDDTRLSRESREKTTEITAQERALKTHVPASMTLAAFISLPNEADIEARIAEQRAILAAAQESASIAARSPLSEFALPELPHDLETLLARTVDNLAADAEEQLADHLAAHSMIQGGAAWLADGMRYLGEDGCPFCGQRTGALPLLAAYRALFSESYASLKEDIASMRSTVVARFGDGPIGKLSTAAEQNNGAVDFWARHLTFDHAAVALPVDAETTMRSICNAALALLDAKAQAPLDAIQADTVFAEAVAAYAELKAKAAVANESIRTTNTLIASQKNVARAANVSAAQTEVTRLEAAKKRHSEEVVRACAAHAELVEQKAALDTLKERARSALEAHTTQVVRPHEDRINGYLQDFNAGFRIAQTEHTYPGGVATSSYQLLIDSHMVDWPSPPPSPLAVVSTALGFRSINRITRARPSCCSCWLTELYRTCMASVA